MKLHRSKLLGYFNRDLLYVFKRKLTGEALSVLPKGCYIVDDNVFVVGALREAGIFKPIWLDRNKGNKEQQTYPTIGVLSDLKDMVKNYSTR